MKKNKFPGLLSRHMLLSMIFFLFCNTQVFSQSDNELYAKAFKEYNAGQWKPASTYLYAYIKRNPSAFSDINYKAQVYAAYNYTVRKLNPPPKEQPENNDGIGSVTSGLEGPPPPLKKPKTNIMIVNRVSMDGTWQFKMTSAGGSIFTGSLTIAEDENVITGDFLLSDNSKTPIIGTFDAGILILVRLTGLETTQVFSLTWGNINRFAGTYKNEGKHADSGTMEMYR